MVAGFANECAAEESLSVVGNKNGRMGAYGRFIAIANEEQNQLGCGIG
ncbi:MAG: hypothetical protein H6658_13725 [Ardenticatenaceae bacterium]|nr:hypothetical protein [Ardenticatenaceae bacterium]